MSNLFPDLIPQPEAKKPIESGGNLFPDLVQPASVDAQKFVPEPFVRNEDIQQDINPIVGMTESFLSGATLGLSDEIQSGIGSIYAKAFMDDSVSDKTISQLAVDIRTKMRDEAKQFRTQAPAASIVPELIGGAATGLGGLLKTSTLKGAAAVGAGEGAIAGSGFTDADDFISGETATGAGIGTAIGAATGFTLPILGRIAKGGFNSLKQSVKDIFPDASGISKKFVEQVESSDGLDDDMARYIINGSGKAQVDPLFDEAVKQGFKPGVIASVKGSTTTDKKKYLKMVDIIKRGRDNSTYAKQFRPGDVAGNSFIERINHIKGVNKDAGKEINKIAKGLRGQPVDIDSALNNFSTRLDELGIDIVERNGKMVPDFEGSILARGDRAAVKEVIRQVTRVSNKAELDGLDAHQLKRAIDNNVTWGKSDGLTNDASTLLKDLRIGIDESLDITFPDYNAANTTYAETIEALNSVVETAGRKMDLNSPNVDKQMGTLLRRLMSNVQSRALLYDTVDLVESTAKKHGGKFDDSVKAQAFFVDDLEEVFGASTQTGFRSEISSGLRDVIGGRRSVVGAGAQLAEKGLEKLEGVSEDAAFEIITELLKRK